ncbi:hypothetical protein BOO36_10595 [Vibrio navarrensis]|nr:hypothetical protein [Vibrio navarrensis]
MSCGKGKAEKEGTRLIGTRLLGRARAEEKERKKWSCGPVEKLRAALGKKRSYGPGPWEKRKSKGGREGPLFPRT